MKKLFFKHGQQDGPQYLEDLATGYWSSEALFTAVELEIFTLLSSEGKSLDEISYALGCVPPGMKRFLHALCAMGLLHEDASEDKRRYFNTSLSQTYLVTGKPEYQGAAILWRKNLAPYWADLKDCLRSGGRVRCNPEQEDVALQTQRIRNYINAMDCIARTKVQEILPLFGEIPAGGEMLDVGAGSGAIASGFLDHYPSLHAVLLDIPEVLKHTDKMLHARGLEKRVTFCPANILETWPIEKGRYDLVVLSNIIHAYSEKELAHILEQAVQCMKEEGILMVHDFFLEHYPEKAALSDLNMLINTYNGKVFSHKRVREELDRLHLFSLNPVALNTDTALLFASKNEDALSHVRVDPGTRLITQIQALGFLNVRPISAKDVHVADWTDLRCRSGCKRYGSPHCPPNSPSPQKTRSLLSDFSYALLLEGEPPTKTFQRKVLQAEREAFISGFHKAFAFWAGPCSLCSSCPSDGTCRNTEEGRPSMEGAGIDVFETVRRAGFSLRTLSAKTDFIKYYALLLLE